MKKIIYLLLLFTLFVGCEKWNLAEKFFLQFTTSVNEDSIHINQALIVSEVKGLNNGTLEEHGHVWSASPLEQPTIQFHDGIDLKGGKDIDGPFQSKMKNLNDISTYHVRAFAQTDDQDFYGNTVTFTTNDVKVYTGSLEYITGDSATLYGCLHAHLIHDEYVDDDITIDQFGFCWSSDHSSPTIENDHFINLGTRETDGAFSVKIGGLEDETLYHYRAFAITRFGSDIIYGSGSEGHCGNSVENYDASVKTWEAELINIWKEREDFEEEGENFPAFTYDGKAYVYTTNKLRIYHPDENIWTESIPKGLPYLYNPVTFTIGDYAYFMIGTTDPNFNGNKCWRFHLINHVWDDLAPFPGDFRVGAVGFAPGNRKAYVGLGKSNIYHRDFWEYNPANPTNNGWERLINDDYPEETSGLEFSFVVNGHGYIGGGWFNGAGELYHFDHEGNSDNWTKKNNLPGGQTYNSTSFIIDQTAYIGAGSTNGGEYSKSFWAYNHMDDSWTSIPDLKGPSRKGAFGFAIGSKGYVGGGQGSNSFLTDFWEYKTKVE